MDTYEKKYKEALELARVAAFNGHQSLMEGIFPELKESEDERIRKALIRFHKSSIDIDGIKGYDILAWLEKQGEKDILEDAILDSNEDGLIAETIRYKKEKQDKQKEINLVEILKHYPKETELYSPLYGKLWLAEVDEKNEIITCYKHHLEEGCTRAVLEQEDTVSFYSNGTTGLPDFNVSKDCMLFLYDIEKQGEQTINQPDFEIPFGAKDSELIEESYYIPKGFHAEIIKDRVTIKKGEQKPAWSVEDTFKVQRICKYLCEAKKYYADITEVRDCIEWLKSLKQRIGG